MSEGTAPLGPPVLVVGEALIDVVDDGRSISEHVGGSPANVAFGISALQHDVDLATWIGRDDRGDRIVQRCTAVGVHLVPGSDGADHTSVARATLDETGAASYHFDITWKVPDLPDLPRYGHVHTGSIGATLEPGGGQVVDLVRRAAPTATISYDPNMRPTLMGSPDAVRDRVETLVAMADLVKASDEDIAWLYPDSFVPDVLRRWLQLGATMAVVTRGGEGAMFTIGDEAGVAAALDVTVADTVGAGDSFMAGLVSGLLDAGLLGGPDERAALRAARLADVRPAVLRAISTGGITVGRTGAYAPTRAELAG